MGARDGAAQRVGERGIDAPRLGQMVERLRLIEAAHLHRPFHRLACASNGESAVFLLSNRQHAAVYLRCERAVDLDLVLAGCFALCQCRIIEERETHSALDLERALARQKYRRGMGIDTFDRRTPVGGGSLKKIDYRLLHVASHAALPPLHNLAPSPRLPP